MGINAGPYFDLNQTTDGVLYLQLGDEMTGGMVIFDFNDFLVIATNKSIRSMNFYLFKTGKNKFNVSLKQFVGYNFVTLLHFRDSVTKLGWAKQFDFCNIFIESDATYYRIQFISTLIY